MFRKLVWAAAVTVAVGHTNSLGTPSSFQLSSIEQSVSHDDPFSPTFPQRLAFNMSFWNATSPTRALFLTTGGEMDVGTWFEITAGQVLPAAAEVGAAVAALEHRLLGLSLLVPNSTADLSSLDPVIASRDVAAALPLILVELQLPADTPVVLFGCSYSGAVAAWSHGASDVVVGVVASSAPVEPLVAMPQYHDGMMQAFADPAAGGSPACASVLQAGLQDAAALIQNGSLGGSGFNVLGAAWNACTPVTQTQDARFLWYQLVDVNLGPEIVQENRLLAIPWACSVLLNASVMEVGRAADLSHWTHRQFSPAAATAREFHVTVPPRDALATLVRLLQSGSCVGGAGAYNAYAAGLADPTQDPLGRRWDRQWWYLQCAHLGWFHTCDAASICPFTSFDFDVLPLEWYAGICAGAFNLTAEQTAAGVSALLDTFGGTNMSAANVAFVNGGDDPWHVLSVLPESPEQGVCTGNRASSAVRQENRLSHGLASPCGATARLGRAGKMHAKSVLLPGEVHTPSPPRLLVPMGWHCSDMDNPRVGDPAALTEARNVVRATIGMWLKATATTR